MWVQTGSHMLALSNQAQQKLFVVPIAFLGQTVLRIIQEMLSGASVLALAANCKLFSLVIILVEVEGFANADVLRGTAFGVAVLSLECFQFARVTGHF